MKCEKCGNSHNGDFGSGRFCSRACANSRPKSKETRDKISKSLKGTVRSDKFKQTVSKNNKNRNSEIKQKISDSLKEYHKNNPEYREEQSERLKGRFVSDDTREKLSEIAKKRGFGGVNQSRWIKYKGKTLGSSYELEVAMSLDENNILWDTCNKFNYVDCNGKSRTYTPDLYLVEYDVYLEPKNDFLIENINPNLGFKDVDKIKWAEEQNNIRVILLNKEQLSWDYIKSQIFGEMDSMGVK